jgi:hypothetical protein
MHPIRALVAAMEERRLHRIAKVRLERLLRREGAVKISGRRPGEAMPESRNGSVHRLSARGGRSATRIASDRLLAQGIRTVVGVWEQVREST